jgi:uncharacterized protein YndB with AHSA1/START domain
MNAHVSTAASYGEMIEPTTLKIQRMLPGSVERVWDYLTKSELRRQWFAAGDMEMKTGTRVRSPAQARLHLGHGRHRRRHLHT